MQKSSKKKPFDFSKYPRKRIALMFLYLGWHHDGLVRQANTENTVEEHLLAALLKTKLIERPEQGEWSRCGRTDKGVSAFRQVAALTVRSTDVSSKHIFWPEDSAPPELRISTDKELPYVRMLNGVLPKTIRVISCATVDEEFSARHSCTQRTYTYIFPRALVKDVSSMNAACSFLVGEHDFRNFCYIDRAENRLGMTYVRGIKEAHVEELSIQKASDQFDLLKLTIIASGFLWHQIRCIVSLLYEIGCGNEQPELVQQLLDINKFPARPNYLLANELPLCLFDCNFPENSLEWAYEPEAISDVINSLQTIWCEHQVKAANIKMMLDELSGKAPQNDFSGLDGFIRMGPTRKGYMPIAKRTRCSGLDELREKSAVKKARLEFLEPDLD